MGHTFRFLIIISSLFLFLPSACQRHGTGAAILLDGGLDGGSDDSMVQEDGNTSQLCGNGVCDPTENAATCPSDCRPCNGLTEQGCCDGDTLFWCDEGTIRSESCRQAECGWSPLAEAYLCGGQGADPSMQYPLSCGCQETKIKPHQRVYHGTADPTAVCMTPGQILAVGALATQEEGGYSNFCTATLIAEDLVLTAAHCVMDNWGSGTRNPDEVFFVVGVDVDEPEHVFPASSLFMHSGYNWEARHDVGLVVLQDSATETLPNIQPIPINTETLLDDFVGQIVQNVGYGSTHDDELNTRRWWTEEPVTDLSVGDFEVYGNGWSSVCYGDSGGPSLYAFDERKLRVVGTVSWGDPSCMDYDHFARVDDNVDFISDYLGGWDPCQSIGETGVCVGSVAQWCEEGQLHQQCCEETCRINVLGNYRCLSESSNCGEIDEKGICIGDELIWCRDNQLVRRYCNICGDQKCAWVDDTIGHACIDR